MHMKNRVGKSKNTNKQTNKQQHKNRSKNQLALTQRPVSSKSIASLLCKSDPPKLKLTGKKTTKLQGAKCRKQRLKLIEIIQEERGRTRRGRGEGGGGGGGGDGDGELEARKKKKGQETGYVRIFSTFIFLISPNLAIDINQIYFYGYELKKKKKKSKIQPFFYK
jgi:hypothetical protein